MHDTCMSVKNFQTEELEENKQPVASHRQTLSHNVLSFDKRIMIL